MSFDPVPRQAAAGLPRHRAATIEAHGCAIALRRVEGPEAAELFLHCQPPAGTPDPGRQAEAVYRAIRDVLEAEGGGARSIVSETVFLRALAADVEPVRESRRRILAAGAAPAHRPALTEIEQSPLNEAASLEVSVHAVMPARSAPRFESIGTGAPCACAECAGVHALRLQLGEETRLQAGGLCGAGRDVHEQTLSMFALAEDLLERAGMTFQDVVRTWIYLRDIDRDYAALNRARRTFFEARGIDPVPASTGIGGGPAGEAHDICLSFCAVKSGRPQARIVMTSPTLNEAPEYGADFVRGMKVAEANRVALYVSGTASIDELGRTAHPADLEAQADRMLTNIAALLEGQGAGFGDVVSAITYLKHAADAERLLARLRAAGFGGFPHALVAAPICRPDLLCETEALALLPPAAAARSRRR